MCRQSRSFCVAATLASLILVTPVCSQSIPIEEHLRNEYQGKTFLLRGFYSGASLLYDSSGVFVGKEVSGDWTNDGFAIVDDVHMSGPRLVVAARRLLVGRSTRGFQFKEARRKSADGRDTEPVPLEITIDLGKSSPSAEETQVAMSRIFLTAQDRLGELVPEYWKTCVPEGIAGRNKDCSFSDEVLAIPGVMPSPEHTVPVAAPTDAKTAGFSHMSIGNGVSPPRALFSPEPEFSEAARGVKYQGVVTLRMVVKTDGTPSDIRIISPLGCGLDVKAVQAVKTWKFKPAEKDGQTIAFDIMVEVDFHLY